MSHVTFFTFTVSLHPVSHDRTDYAVGFTVFWFQPARRAMANEVSNRNWCTPGNLIFDSPAIAPKKDISLFVKVCECSPFFLAVVAGLLLVLSFCFFVTNAGYSQKHQPVPHSGMVILRVAG